MKFLYLHFFFLSHNFNWEREEKMVQIKVIPEMLEEVANRASNTRIALMC